MSVSFISPKIQTRALPCLLLALAIFGAASCGGRSASKANAKENTNEPAAANTPNTSDASAPVAVTTAKAVAREVPSYIQSTGSLVAEETSDVASQASGQVVATPVGVGAFVRQG
ncbi:MAG TPA: hypothetical protein VER76_10935, partial [Pyrinomonadaceae bacterium]|nr:hypothetical protein [Pyrinomonadaceae bacterium]